MRLLISLRSEILKTRRTAAFYFTVIGAAIVPLIFVLNLFSDGLPDQPRSNKDPLNAMFALAGEMNSVAIFPLFLILGSTLLAQVEFKNNSWKQVMTSPQSKLEIFGAKFINLHLLLVLFLVLSHLFVWMVCVLAHFVLPELDVLNQPFNGQRVWIYNCNTYVTILALSAIQFWMGLRFKNFIVSVSIGLILWLIGTVLALQYHSPYANYFPHSFHTFITNAEVKIRSCYYAIVILALGFLDFKNRRFGE